jgi:hypothetical protein
MKIGDSCNSDTIVSYCPFFLLKKGENEYKFPAWRSWLGSIFIKAIGKKEG